MLTLVLSNIRFRARHGATAAERRSYRAFEVDVEVDAPLQTAQSTDRLADTIDYRDVAQVILDVGTGKVHHLLEALARHMMDELATRFSQATIRLELRKLSPPGCPGRPNFAAVRMSRTARR
jgi:dihydroneopterin aldolase